MTTELTIRRFEPRDGERVRELNERAMANAPEFVPDAPDDDLADVSANYLDSPGEFLVAERAGTVVATGALTSAADWKDRVLDDLHPDALEVTRMRVDPDHQRTGVGRAVYEALEELAAAADRPELVLDTGARNGPARGFYEDVGFELADSIEVDFRGTELELVLYRKPLDG